MSHLQVLSYRVTQGHSFHMWTQGTGTVATMWFLKGCGATHTVTYPLALTATYAHSLTHTDSLTHSFIHTLILTHTHSQTDTHTHKLNTLIHR